MTFGNWDFDNVRLTAIPEPGSVAVLGLGLGGLLMIRARANRRSKILRSE
jgi:hypothetical protein